MMAINRMMMWLAAFTIGALLLASGPGSAEPWDDHLTAAGAAFRSGKPAEAEKHYLSALKEAEAFGPDDVRLGATLDQLAAAYMAQDKAADAEKALRRALPIWEKIFGAMPDMQPVISEKLDLLIETLDAQKKYGDVESLVKRSLGITEELLGPNHIQMAEKLENFAPVLRGAGMAAEAKAMETRAKSIRVGRANNIGED